MKFEFEVDESVMHVALQNKVTDEVRQRVAQWGSDKHIKARVAALWAVEVDKLIAEQLANSDKLKEQIATLVERKLRAKLDAAIRAREEAVPV